MYVDKGFLKGCLYWSFDRRRKKCVNMGRLPSLPSTSVTFYQNLLWLRHWGRHRTLVSDKQCIQFSSSISSSFILSNQKMLKEKNHWKIHCKSSMESEKHRHRRNVMSYRFKSLFKLFSLFWLLSLLLTIITSLTILALVGNLDHQVAPLALLGNLATRWHHLH